MSSGFGIRQLHVLETQMPTWADHKARVIAGMLTSRTMGARNGRVLDIGCGIGTFSRRLSARGFDVTGMDISASCVKKTKSAGVNAVVGDGCRPPKSFNGRFDAVLLLDVLEHSPDPVNVLKGARRTLKREGTVIVTVPAHPFLYSDYDKALGHFRRYDKRELREELDRAGFAVEDVFYWNFWGFWLTLLSKAIGKNPTGVANPISNALT
ncbi:MAG: class I SAM-dependent methyltransferase, partial [Candidatus Micrarchaeota archaeon]